MFLGSLMLALWTGQSIPSTISIGTERIFSLDTGLLVLVIMGVITLSALMSESGIMKDLVLSLRARLSQRSLLAALPAVVGLLPMPAGALFSAPLVDDADAVKTLTPVQKSQINYWFRHVWEFWWPLYPGVLLAVDISGLPIWQFVLTLFPLFFAAVAGGYLFLFKNVAKGKPEPRGADDKAFLPLILPILTVIAVYGLLLVTLPSLSRFNKYLPMVIGVACGLAALQLQRPAVQATWRKVLLAKRMYSLAILIVLTRLYAAFIEARLPDGAPLMDKIRLELNDFGIPALVLIIIIPFISGLTTGITVGYIGASFPVVLSLAGPSLGELNSTIVLGYACGFLGMMLSPIHVCLIVTNEYFRTDLIPSLRGLLRPALVLFLCAGIYSLFWRLVG